MDWISEYPVKVKGKVLLYTTPNKDVPPAMTMNQDITNHLPTILKKLSG